MRNDRRGGLAAVVVAIVLLLLLLYVASLGPAVWLYERGYLSDPTVEAIYQPLQVAADRCKPVEIVLDRYAAPWRKSPRPPQASSQPNLRPAAS